MRERDGQREGAKSKACRSKQKEKKQKGIQKNSLSHAQTK